MRIWVAELSSIKRRTLRRNKSALKKQKKKKKRHRCLRVPCAASITSGSATLKANTQNGKLQPRELTKTTPGRSTGADVPTPSAWTYPFSVPTEHYDLETRGNLNVQSKDGRNHLLRHCRELVRASSDGRFLPENGQSYS